MKILLTLFFGMTLLYSSSIYTQQYTSLYNNEVNMSQFKNKKILLVNIASESEYAAVQIPALNHLYQQYKDSLIVIGFPSNDFGNEPRSNEELKILFQNTYHTSFPLSVRVGVKDSAGVHPIYSWLQHKEQNGAMNTKIKTDFQKYLIDGDGNIIGIFSGGTKPDDPSFIQAITQ
jgi:glutathione peroxidase